MLRLVWSVVFFFFKQKTAYEMLRSLVGSEMCIRDRCTPAQVEQIHATCNELLRSLKEQGHTIHLSLSGGRRMIALMALQAAMVHLSPVDRLWHIYTTPELTAQARDGKIMHVPPEGGVRLIPVPFVPLAA